MIMKNYIITGASSGIGESCVKALASDDVRQIIVGRNIEKLIKLSKELPGEIFPIKYDLIDLENIKSLFLTCSERGFKLDGMVYCAGLDGFWPVKVNQPDKMQEVMTVNCFAFVEMSKCFYSKSISNDGASIVAVSSISSLTNEKGMLAYSMSKAALNSAVKTISKEFVRRRIRVNAILPGGVDTQMAYPKEAMLKGIKNDEITNDNAQPLGIIPTKFISDQILYLLSEQAQYITGELYTVSAGRTY